MFLAVIFWMSIRRINVTPRLHRILDELLRGECFMAFQSSYYVSSQETMSYSSGLTMNYPWLHVMDDDAEEFVSGGLSLHG